ncbi:hypothetical protein C8A00DRAFT_46330 [Chaetomidium leptoderma]|uniref:Uncharacterized protein n=1 Tax=Chaetomidium leptoderma TaxID=669021 RepID=A0AAN6VGS3_9PEZI|nr:hypothetical protein C8A00DRAFT_46330 [Chaetomidium leptoderma]
MKPLRSVVGAVLAVGALLWPTVYATPTPYGGTRASVATRQTPSACSEGGTIESLWLVKQLNVTYANDLTVQPGNASWTITNTLTNTTKQIRCPLRANYICELDATLGESDLHIWLQINLDVARFSLNQSLPCGSEVASKSAYAVGNAELYLLCRDTAAEENLSCYGDDDAGVFANGLVTLNS